MTSIKKTMGIVFVAMLALVIIPRLAFADCPNLIDTPDKLRFQVRVITLDYLSNPTKHSVDPAKAYSKDEILDLISFYKNRAKFQAIKDCNEKGTNSQSEIVKIMQKTISFKSECNDGKDNDKDGKIDLDDPGCSELLDNDETNCGDKICGKSENCFSCSSDCGVCNIPAHAEYQKVEPQAQEVPKKSLFEHLKALFQS